MNKVDKVVNWVENLLRFAKENGGYFLSDKLLLICYKENQRKRQVHCRASWSAGEPRLRGRVR